MAITAFVWAVIATIASTAISVAMAVRQKKEMEDAQAGILIQKQGGTHPVPVIYGERRVAPVKVWDDKSRQRLPVTSILAVADSGFTHNNEFNYKSQRDDEDFLHRIDVWCQGPVESIGSYEIDDDGMLHKRFTTVKNNRPLFRSLNKHGADTQTMFTALTGGFDGVTSDMTGNGIAWSWNSFLYTADTPQYYGDPQVTALIKGIKLWDPRDNPSDPTIKTWSDNPALVLLDYMTASYGKGLTLADIDLDSIIAAANECDVVVTLPTQDVVTDGRFIYDKESGEYIFIPIGGTDPNGNPTGTQKRFTCNLVLQPDVDSKENVTEILKTFKGALPFINGQYVLSMEIAASSVMAFDDDNIIDGVNISYGDRSRRFNQVTVKFPNALKGHKEDAVTWPVTTSATYTTLLAEDSGEKLATETRLSGVTSYSQAEDLAEFMVRDSRNQQIITFKTQPLAMQLEPNDIITVTTSALDYVAQPYRVREVKLGTDLTVTIVAQEYDPTVYPWYVGEPEAAPAYTPSSLFDEPTSVQGFLAGQEQVANSDNAVLTNITTTWDAIVTGTASVDVIYVGYKRSGVAEYVWATLPAGETSYTIVGVGDNLTYDLVIRYRNIVGRYSADTTQTVTTAAVTPTITNLVAAVASDLVPILEDAQNLEATVDTMADSMLTLALTQSDTLGKLNDAGIVVDPSNGTVSIAAVETLRTETGVTTSDLGVRLDAAEGSIVLKATTTYVNDAIAAAVLDSSDLASLTALQAQVNNAEIDIDANEAAILLKASQLTVDGLQLDLTQAEIDIDAAEAAILLKTDSTTFDALDTRVGTAEVSIAALDGASITQTVTDTRFLQGEMDLTHVQNLATLLETYKNRAVLKSDIAFAQQAISADVSDLRIATATARTELGSLIDANAATLVSEQLTRASEDAALSSDITTLTATVGLNSASITTNALATADSLGVLEAKYGVQLDVNGYVTGFVQNNDGTTGSFVINTDNFKIVDPNGGAGQLGINVFEYSGGLVQLGTGVELSADRITAGVLAAERITLAGRDLSEMINDVNFQTDTEVTASIAAEALLTAADIAALQIVADDAQATADGKIDSFYQPTAPTVASEGDIWFDTDDGNKIYTYRSTVWTATADSGIAQAILDASGAQATADGKVTSFYQTTAPTAEGTGDFWIDTDDGNRLYRWNSAAWIDVRDAGVAQAIQAAADSQDTADGKIDSFYQITAPTGASEGDLWFDTDDGNKLYTYRSAVWVETQDSLIGQAISDASTAQDTADGKIVTFYQTTVPTAEGTGDLWVDTDAGNKLYRWNGTTWITVQDTSIATAQAAANLAIANAATSQSTADGKIDSFYQTTAPAGASEGDLWFDTDDGNKLYTYRSSVWTATVDSGIAQAISDASTAQSTADGKVTTFFGTAAPTAEGTGDLWVDTDDGNKLYRWSGTAWVVIQDGDIAVAQAAADLAIANAAAAEVYADTLVVNLTSAAEVAAAIAADTTVIDGARITTGTIAAARISISGLNASELTNDVFATPADIPDVSTFQSAAEVAAAIASDTTVIDGARITTGVINANLITAGTISADRISIDGNYLTVVGGALQISQAFQDTTVTQPTLVNDATGNTDPSITVTRITGGKVSLGVSWSLNKATGAFTVSNPFPVVVQLKRDGTVLTSWTVTTGLGGFYEAGVPGDEPSFVVGRLNTNYIDNSGVTGTAVYSVSVTTLSTTDFTLATQISGQAVI